MIDRDGETLAASGWGLVILLAAASLGEGGASPTALLAIHLCLGALVVFASVEGSRGERTFGTPAKLPWTLLLLFVAVSLAGAAMAPYGFAAWLVLVEQSAFLAAAWIAVRCGAGFMVRLAPVLLLGAAAQGAIAIGQRIQLAQARPAGTFLNTNHLAAWLVAALTLGLGVWPGRPTPRALALRAAGAILVAAGLVLCGSRGALIGLAVSVLSVLPLALRARVRPARRWAVIAAMAVLALAALVGVAVRLRTSDPFLYHRVRIWRASLGAVAQAPFAGTGPGQFEAAAANLNFPLDDAPLRFERSFISPHSDLLRALCELGIPGALLVLSAIAIVAVSIGRRIARNELSTNAAVAAAALAGLLAQSAVDDLTDRPALFLLFAAVAGSLLSTPRRGSERLPGGIRCAALVALVTLLAVGEVSPWLAWRAQHGLPRGRLDTAQRARLDSAIAHNPAHPDGWLRRAEDRAGSGTDWDAVSYAEARDAAERAVRLQPADARYRLGVARIEALACLTLFGDVGTRERASQAYTQAQELARHDPFVALEQGRFLLATGDPAGARRAAERALAIEPEAVPGRLLLAESIAVEPVPGAHARALAVLRDADATARRWSGTAQETPYARALLSMDDAWRRSIRARVTEVDSGAASP